MNKLRNIFGATVAVAKTTATELLGQPVIMLLILCGILLIAMVPLLHFHEFGEAGRLCRDSALAYQLVIGTLIAVVASSSSIHSEITNGTALAALGKPVSREAFLCGKWLGVISVTTRFWFCTLATEMVAWRISPRFVDLGEKGMGMITDSITQSLLLLVPPLALAVSGILHNRKGYRFCKTTVTVATIATFSLLLICTLFTNRWLYSPKFANVDIAVIPVSILILLALMTYSAIASALSTRLNTAPVLIISLILLALGLSYDSISVHLPTYLTLPIPNLQSFWMCDAVANGQSLPDNYLLFALLYTVSCIGAALGIGILLFRDRDIG